MAKKIDQDFFGLLADFLFSDKLANPAGVMPPLGTHGTEKYVPLIQILGVLAEDFLPDINGNSPRFLRSEAEPLDIHLESGTSASQIKLPGIVKAITGTSSVSIDVPDEYSDLPDFFEVFFSLPYSFVSDINLKPAENLGKIDFVWDSTMRTLELRFSFETEGKEIKGSFDFNMQRIEVSLFLKPRLSAKRILWEYAVLSLVEASGDDLAIASLKSSSKQLEDLITVNRVPVGASGGASNIIPTARDAASGLADGITGAVFPPLEGWVELVGNAIMALPLRPITRNQPALTVHDVQSAMATAFASHSDPNIGILGLLISLATLPLTQKEISMLEVVSGHLQKDLADAALGFQNLSNVFPFENIDTVASRFRDIFLGQLAAWVSLLPQGHLNNVPAWPNANDQRIQNAATPLGLFKDELLHLLFEKAPGALFSSIKKSTEFAHIVDRTRRLKGEPFAEDTDELPQLMIWDDDFIKADLEKVPCMRYQVSLDLARLDDPKLSGHFVNQDLVLRFELLSSHEEIDGRFMPEVEGTPARAATLLATRDIPLKLKGMETNLGSAFRRTVFLEWSTKTLSRLPNSHLTIKVAISVKGRDTSIIDCETTIPITHLSGLSHPDEIFIGRVPVPGNKFQLQGSFREQQAITIFGSLMQMPFAQNYQWVRIDIKSWLLPLTKASDAVPNGARVALQAFLDDKLFAATAGLVLGDQIKRNQPFALGDGWDQQILFRTTDYNKSFTLKLVWTAISAEIEGGSKTFELTKVFHRFSTLDEQPVLLDPAEIALLPLQSPERIAYDKGARLEWGFEMGLPYSTRMVGDPSADDFAVLVKISNQNFQMQDKPQEVYKKLVEISVPRVHIIDDGDNLSKGEVRFKISGESKGFKFGNQTQEEIATREFDVDSHSTLELPGPPSFKFYVEPGMGQFEIRCRGIEKDGPQWIDPDDPLGTAVLTLDDSDPAGIDGEHLRTGSSSDGKFEATFVVRTLSAPPAPRFSFVGLPEGMNLKIASQNEAVRVEYAAAWGESLTLVSKLSGPDPWIEENVLPGLAGSFDITDQNNKLYAIRNGTASDGTLSAVLTVVRI